jgi:shikimate kinase
VINQQIVIVGFMGTGKTTVAHELGRKLDRLAVDLDELIARRHGRSPNEIILQDGESRFRELETELLRAVLEEEPGRIIAAGGGAWTIPENRKLVAAHRALTVWLDATFELCWKRIQAGGETRPLARSREAAEQLYHDRRPIYELADLRVPVADADNAEEIALRIATEVSRLNAEP